PRPDRRLPTVRRGDIRVLYLLLRAAHLVGRDTRLRRPCRRPADPARQWTWSASDADRGRADQQTRSKVSFGDRRDSPVCRLGGVFKQGAPTEGLHAMAVLLVVVSIALVIASTLAHRAPAHPKTSVV